MQILAYAPEFREAFKRLNIEWIEKYFAIEEQDRYPLEEPESTILAPGWGFCPKPLSLTWP